MKKIINYNSFLNESKKSQQKFFKDVEKILKQYGGVKKETEYNIKYEFTSKKYGKFTASLHTDDDDKIYSVFGRFDDEKLVKDDPKFDSFDLNKYSGKCNFHNRDAGYVIEQLEKLLKIIKD
jgi:uncharacterized lipoprotein YehR (DUF1307 family)